MSGEPLIGEADPDGRRSVFRVNLEPHRLGRLPSRPGNLIWFHHHKPAKRCSSFQAESFRLRNGRWQREHRRQLHWANNHSQRLRGSNLPTCMAKPDVPQSHGRGSGVFH
jgi:hypothetical protein